MPRPSRPPLPLLTLVFASGAAALLYQSLWLRAFGLVFGSATDATAMVLAIFMGGLAIGSAWSARLRVERPLRAYALVEMGIAATALATLPLLRWLPEMYASVSFLRGLSGTVDVLARAALAALVLLPSTMLLGATLPLAVEAQARRGHDEQWSLGRLYLANTLALSRTYFPTFRSGWYHQSWDRMARPSRPTCCSWEAVSRRHSSGRGCVKLSRARWERTCE